MLKSSLVLTLTLTAAAAAFAADVAPGTATKRAATTAASATSGAPGSAFMIKAGGDGMAEVELGRLALERASSADVKAFAQMMVDDHSKANAELTSLAGTKGVTLPGEPPPPAKAAKDHLSTLSGAAFDKAYMDHMVKDHEKAVALFSKEASGGKDPEAKDWAAKTLPALQQHLAKARQLAAGHGSAGHTR